MSSFIDSVAAGDKQAIIALVSMYFAAMCLFSLVYCLRIRSWPQTTGTVPESDVEAWGTSRDADDQNYAANVRDTYRVRGEDYEGARLSPTSILATVNLRALIDWQMRGITKLRDGQVAVFYNDAKPEKSYLVRPGALIIGFLAAVIAISALGIAANLQR